MSRVWTPNAIQVERLRLLLSTYQDGTGMNVDGDKSIPGWRDFERSVASAFGGVASESKDLFDVLLTDSENIQHRIGLSCKMRGELDRVLRDGRATIEVSNSAGVFWDHLNLVGIDQTNYKNVPEEVGAGLLRGKRSGECDKSRSR